MWTQPLRIVVYPVCVERLLDRWDEQDDRERALLGIGEATRRLSMPEMAELCLRFDARLHAARQG